MAPSQISEGCCLHLMLPLLLLLLLLPTRGAAIYCDADDCYDLLGVSQNANASEIKRAYYKLSLKHHPDKNPDPDSKKLFLKIANAYEILKDETTRQQYDYAIAHPEEVFYNTAQYYRAYYAHKTDARAVLVGFLLFVSLLQYLNHWTRYTQAISMVKRTPAYKNRLKALELQRTGGITNKKKGNKQLDKKMEDDLDNELELQIQGVEKPSVWKLFGIQFLLLPYTAGKPIAVSRTSSKFDSVPYVVATYQVDANIFVWRAWWLWRYQIKKYPYSWEDASYLTMTSLKVAPSTWHTIDDSVKDNLVTRRLWEEANMEKYRAETRKESKRRR